MRIWQVAAGALVLMVVAIPDKSFAASLEECAAVQSLSKSALEFCVIVKEKSGGPRLHRQLGKQVKTDWHSSYQDGRCYMHVIVSSYIEGNHFRDPAVSCQFDPAGLTQCSSPAGKTVGDELECLAHAIEQNSEWSRSLLRDKQAREERKAKEKRDDAEWASRMKALVTWGVGIVLFFVILWMAKRAWKLGWRGVAANSPPKIRVPGQPMFGPGAARRPIEPR